MSKSTPPDPDPNDGPEMERLRRLSAVPQVRLDVNFVHLVNELRTGIDALCLTIRHSEIDQSTTPDSDLRKTWGIYVMLLTQVARHLSIIAEDVDTRVRRLLDIEATYGNP